MKNCEKWQPTKFMLWKGRVRASRDRTKVQVSSRLIADLIGEVYAKHIPLHCRGHLLDLGCGHVPFYFLYKDLIEASTCVDWGESEHPNEYLDLEHDLTKPLPFNNETFDTIICSDVLEHIPTPQRLWSEMARTLKPGGKLLINVPFMYWIHESPHDYHRYTEFALRFYAEEAGLAIRKLEAIGGILEVLADLVAKNLMRFKWPGRLMASFVQSIVGRIRRTNLGLRFSKRSAKNYPLFYFLVVEKI